MKLEPYTIRLSPEDQERLRLLLEHGEYKRQRKLRAALELALKIPPAADGSIDVTPRAISCADWSANDLWQSITPLVATVAVTEEKELRKFFCWVLSWVYFDLKLRFRKMMKLS
jgi:hypothetical protein